MKYLLPLPIIFFGVMFYVGNSTPEVPATVNSSTSEKNQKKKKNKKDIIYRERVKATDPILFVKKTEPLKLWDEKRFDNQWQEELFYLLKHIDRERGEVMFNAYVKEMRDHDERMKNNLTLSLNGLSALNGESGMEEEAEEGRAPSSVKDPAELEVHHEEKLKTILGEHYDLVLEQEKLFNEERSLEAEI